MTPAKEDMEEEDKAIRCECGYKTMSFFVQGEVFPKEWECPICMRVHQVSFYTLTRGDTDEEKESS